MHKQSKPQYKCKHKDVRYNIKMNLGNCNFLKYPSFYNIAAEK